MPGKNKGLSVQQRREANRVNEIGERVLWGEHGDGVVLPRGDDNVCDALFHLQADEHSRCIQLDLIQFVHTQTVVHVSRGHHSEATSPFQFLLDFLTGQTVVKIFRQLGLVLHEAEKIPDEKLASIRDHQRDGDVKRVEIDWVEGHGKCQSHFPLRTTESESGEAHTRILENGVLHSNNAAKQSIMRHKENILR